MNPVRRTLLAALTRTVSLTVPVAAQCDPAWAPGDSPPTMLGSVHHMATWDPDGGGPLPSVLVCAGDAGGISPFAARVCTFDGVRWTQLGDLAADSGSETARVAVIYNGQLMVATEDRLVAWTGSSWQTLATVDGIRAMQVYNGELYVTGSFTSVVGMATANIARWNGLTWSTVGSGIGGTGRALAVFQNVLYVGGQFATAGGQTAGNLAIWNGTTWIATASANGAVTAMATRVGTALTNSFLFVGGAFTSLGVPAQRVARFSPSSNSWTAMGAGLVDSCAALAVRATGLSSYVLYAAVDGSSARGSFRWDGTTSTWIDLGLPAHAISVDSLAAYGGQHVIGIGTAQYEAVHRSTGGAWTPLLGAGIVGSVYAVLADGDATFVGGTFATISGTVVNGIAHGTPGNWTPLGTGFEGPVAGGAVFTLARLPNGDLVAGGNFTIAGGQPANYIARWNGTTWSAFGTGTSGPVLALAVLPNGDLVAGGDFTLASGGVVNRIARWNGSAWAPMGAGFNGTVNTLLVRADGDLVAGGAFTNLVRIARWNGVNWFSFAGGVAGAVESLAELPNGDLLAGGYSNGGFVSRWNGTSWSQAGTPPPNTSFFEALALAPLPDGDVLAAGPYGIFRLHAGAWSSTEVTSFVWALDQGPDEVWRIGGSFDTVAGVASARFARRPLPCPATVTAAGNGCGGNVLTVTSQAWANGVLRAQVTGMPAPAWALAVWGLSPVVPALSLDSVFAEALPGCQLHVVPDGTETLYAPAGVTTTSLSLPNVPPLVGASLYHQVVALVVDARFQPLEISTSNAVQATVGIF